MACMSTNETATFLENGLSMLNAVSYHGKPTPSDEKVAVITPKIIM